MSRATILFYKDNFVYPIFKKVFGAKGLSKTEFTAFLFSKAKKICKENNFDSFSIIKRIDTIEELKNG